MDNWYSIYSRIPDKIIVLYLFVIFVFYLSFILGTYLFKKKYINKAIKRIYFNKQVLDIFLCVLIAISCIYIYRFRNDFFTGYNGHNSLEFSQKGPFIALSLVAFVLAMIYSNKLENDIGGKINFNNIIINKFFIFYFFVAVLILSLGGRLYFISSLMMIFVYRTVYFESVELSKSIRTISIIIIIMLVIGASRTGSFNIEKMIFNIFQEPLYTAFSLISFLDAGIIEILNLPKFLVSSLINLIPTFILPNKMSYILNPLDFGYTIYNPLGATNLFVSMIINFGIIGSIWIFFFLGLFLEVLKTKKKSIVSRVIYICVSGFLPFTFFRDGFVTSIIKNIFQFSILMPIIIVLSAHFISIAIKGQSIK